MRTPALLVCLCLLMLLAAPLSARERYRIDTHSPDSWARYYQLIGLGNVRQAPLSDDDLKDLSDHCDFLEAVTGHDWIPLGYSVERGYMLCYRRGPFSAAEAHVFCDRLMMDVLENSGRAVICETLRDDRAYLQRNPYRNIY